MEYVKIGQKQLRQTLEIAHTRFTLYIVSAECQTLIYSDISSDIQKFFNQIVLIITVLIHTNSKQQQN